MTVRILKELKAQCIEILFRRKKMTEKKPIFKRKWFIALVIVVIAVAVGTTMGGGEKSKDSDTAKKTEETKDEEIKGAIGEVLSVGKVDYTVNSSTTATTVGSEYLQETADGIFVIVDITITNNGDEALLVSDSFFKLLLSGKEFKTDTAPAMYVEDSMVFEELNPGSTVTGKVFFDVTEEVANDPALELQLQTGAWGTETGIVKLK